jgi:hypothetical protein
MLSDRLETCFVESFTVTDFKIRRTAFKEAQKTCLMTPKRKPLNFPVNNNFIYLSYHIKFAIRDRTPSLLKNDRSYCQRSSDCCFYLLIFQVL